VTERNLAAIDRTRQRRRLGILAGVLALVAAVGPAVAGAGGAERAVAVAAADIPVRAAAGTPTGVRAVAVSAADVEGSASSLEATVAPTTSTVPTTTAAPSAPTTTTTEAQHAEEPTTTTVAEPRPAPAPTSTTAAPTTTTTAPPARREPASTGYAYDDPRSTQVWYDLAACEAGGDWSIDSGNGYYGGLQFGLATWQSVGGAGYPHEHPAATQIEMGRRLQARQGWGAWPHCAEELGLR